MGIVFMFHKPFKKNNNESITFYWFFILFVCLLFLY